MEVKLSLQKKEESLDEPSLIKKRASLLTKNMSQSKNLVWMSHEDAVIKLPRNFKLVASTKILNLQLLKAQKKKIYGVQFHPEVTHTENGKQIFKNYLFSIESLKKIKFLLKKEDY